MRVSAGLANQAAVAAFGARPEALSAIGFLVPGLAIEREAVAADARHVRLDHGQHRGGGDRRVDRVAALRAASRCRSRLAAGCEVAHMARRP